MDSFIGPRRQFLRGLVSLSVCAPSVVRASSLMGVSARFCRSFNAAPLWPTADALALLQHEMERRFTETLFGPQNLSAEDEGALPPGSPALADARITALWELRTRFGPRGAPLKPLAQMPAEVRAGLFSMLEGPHGMGVARDKSVLRSI